MANAKPTKPQPRRVPSDDCEVTIRGESYHPHVGESLWVIGSETIGQMKSRWAFLHLSSELDEAKEAPQAEGESEEDYKKRVEKANGERIKLIEAQYDDLVHWFAVRLAKWDWTDNASHPHPELDGTITPFMNLSMDEVYYIKNVLSGEGPAEALNVDTASASPS
jgi:hypothetical protein